MPSRTWIKIYCDKWLSGTLREESPELRGIWTDLLALAGSGLYGDIGEIKLQNGIGLTDFQFQKLLNISKYQWLKSKKRLLDTERIAIDALGAIQIINWKRYQSEYERQKPYRNQKLQPKVTQENKIEIEIENKGTAKKRSPPQPVLDILDEMKAYLGYPGKRDKDPIPNYGKESQFIKKMLARGFTHMEIMDCWKGKVNERDGDFVSMVWVNEDIGKKRGKGRAHKQGPRQLKPRDQYTKIEDYQG